MTHLMSYATMTINLTGEEFRQIFCLLGIQHVTTPRTDVSVLVCMPCPKIHSWQSLVSRIDHRPVASVKSGRSVLHSATTFELQSVHAAPTTLQFFLSVALYAISCGGYVYRYHLSSVTPVASIICLHP
ncbi:hypothetical protein TNIN_465521 [Trichonephila inaurata madagascariensis]|uniref:Uncharacterized protein n=1 Tax=Trichonephila inaurata madagascariensis TaxID=2747483 RepID=A0A8X6IBZ5_9ARAC|nr:hypothetical protein TNIN_465521 [Trichonephila inaurata madagascariensis]